MHARYFCVATIVFAGIGMCFAALLVLSQRETHIEYEIVRTKTGFEPSTLTIETGDIVRFTTNRLEPFWPASNLHPSHGIYPAFDSKSEIQPGNSWSFTFETPGLWNYHDHLDSTVTGVITVVDLTKKQALASTCSPESTEPQCVETRVTQAFETGGVEAAFAVLADYANEDFAFSQDCHAYAHVIGEHAYTAYAAGEVIDLSDKTSYCGFGFYHGFMETLLLTTGDASAARAFCREVDKGSFSLSSAARTACFHGVGHGAADGSDERRWGNPDAMMEPAFKLCEMIAETDFEQYLCATGVYNALERLSDDPKYKLTSITKDPFSFCNDQSPERREPCYTNMLPAVLRHTDTDFNRAGEYVVTQMQYPDTQTIVGHTALYMTLSGLAHEYVRVYGDEPNYESQALMWCRSFDEPLLHACVEGLVGGQVKYGEPHASYISVLTFCSRTELTEEERNVCSDYFFSHINVWYPQENLPLICDFAQNTALQRNSASICGG